MLLLNCCIAYDYVDKIGYFKKVVKKMLDYKIVDDIEKLMTMKRSEIAISFSEIFCEEGGRNG